MLCSRRLRSPGDVPVAAARVSPLDRRRVSRVSSLWDMLLKRERMLAVIKNGIHYCPRFFMMGSLVVFEDFGISAALRRKTQDFFPLLTASWSMIFSWTAGFPKGRLSTFSGCAPAKRGRPGQHLCSHGFGGFPVSCGSRAFSWQFGVQSSHVFRLRYPSYIWNRSSLKTFICGGHACL